MKKLLLLIIITSYFYGSTFADMAWFTGKEKAVSNMVSRGYSLLVESQMSSTVTLNIFTGKVLQEDANIALCFESNKLVKVKITIDLPYNNKQEMFNKARNVFDNKYFNGKYIASFSFPYEENDGYTDTAISVGKARFICLWEFIDGDIGVSIQDGKKLDIDYESKAWGAILDKMLAEKNRDL